MIVLFWISLVIIFYTFLGYPLLIKIFQLFIKRKTDNNKNYNQPITIVMVVCNEEEFIKSKIVNIYSQDYEIDKIRLIIVDDASEDRTVDFIKSFNKYEITLIEQPTRQGKAEGINCAMKQVETELVMFVDARQEITNNAIKDLSSWFVSDERTVAISGEVKFKSKNGTTSGMDAYQAYERSIRLGESKIFSVPGVSGAIYMLKTEFFKLIPKDTILDDVLIPMNAVKDGGWIGFDERVIAWDIASDDLDREKRRKTRTLNGNYQLLFRNIHWCIPGLHPAWFQYFSHKVLRLTAPFFAILFIVASFSLGLERGKVYFVMGALTLIVISIYPLTLSFPVLNRISLVRIGASFVALNWFNLLGFFQYSFSRKKQSWK